MSVDVPTDKARAVVDAMERNMGATLMTVRLGSIQVVAAGLLFAALKLT